MLKELQKAVTGKCKRLYQRPKDDFSFEHQNLENSKRSFYQG